CRDPVSEPAWSRRARPPRGKLDQRRQSLSTGAYLSSNRFTPSDPKSIEATALSATPSSATTVPSPKVSWVTRSPGSSEGTSRAGLAFDAASARAAAEEKLRRPAAVGEPSPARPPDRSGRDQAVW